MTHGLNELKRNRSHLRLHSLPLGVYELSLEWGLVSGLSVFLRSLSSTSRKSRGVNAHMEEVAQLAPQGRNCSLHPSLLLCF